MKTYIFLILLICCIATNAQISLNNLIIYPDPPVTDGVDRHNDDFSVRVRILNGTWKNLYEYKTYVNSGYIRGENTASSFVSFDFNGAVEIEVTSNWANINSVLIRPQSKGIAYNLTGNTVRFQINKPEQFSLEINGDRYRNLHIFANKIISRPLNATKIFRNDTINTLPNNKYIAQDNEIIYFEPGAIVKGGIYIREKSNVKIIGHGILEMLDFEKNYNGNPSSSYQYLIGIALKRSDNVYIDGPIINDTQHYCVELTESEFIDIKDVKMFSRVIWGDGIDMVGSNNINISESFIRTADDAIAIYSTRIGWSGNPNPEYKNAYDISVKNTSLYADAAHPIEIGFHGSRDNNLGGNWIGRIHFDGIDILEQDVNINDEHWAGAISINCADENTCRDFTFRNINIEEFTNGRIFNIEVESAGIGAAITNGHLVRNIVFDNLVYNGFGEFASVIKGLNCDRYVDGVHFHDLTINGQIIRNLTDYTLSGGSPGFETNPYAYNITFQEKNNYSTTLPSGFYKIRNKQSLHYLTATTLVSASNGNAHYVATSTNQNTDNQVWEVTNLGGHYRIKSVSNGNYLDNSDEFYINDCTSRYIFTNSEGEFTTQEWKIVPKPEGGYTINNAYTRGYLEPSTQQINIKTKYVINKEKNGLNNQLWEFQPVSSPLILDGSFASNVK